MIYLRMWSRINYNDVEREDHKYKTYKEKWDAHIYHITDILLHTFLLCTRFNLDKNSKYYKYIMIIKCLFESTYTRLHVII